MRETLCLWTWKTKFTISDATGVFTKSKSFNGSDGKPKVQFLDKGSEKRKFSYETAVSTKGKGCAARSLQKSLSFSDANAGRSNSLDVETKTNAPKPSEFKRLRHVKDCSSVDMEVKPLLKKPRVLSPDGSFSSVSSGDKFASHWKPCISLFFLDLSYPIPKPFKIQVNQAIPGIWPILRSYETPYVWNHPNPLPSR